ncbi:MAG: histidine phosphatase family protein [bacterium]|nr:histidine phosphatase family protein [bacterium]
MIRTTEVLVVRHGETAWNAEGRIQGHRPVGLNERGKAQAAATADRLASERFDILYSSDLERAMETARAIAGRTGHEIFPDVRLREWNLGVLEGLSSADAEVRYPEAYRAYRVEQPDVVIPGGESLQQRYERSVAGVVDLAARHAGERIVIVTHGGVLDDLYRRTKHIPLDAPRDFKIYNSSLNTFHIHGETWTLIRWGEIEHLEGIGAMGDW